MSRFEQEFNEFRQDSSRLVYLPRKFFQEALDVVGVNTLERMMLYSPEIARVSGAIEHTGFSVSFADESKLDIPPVLVDLSSMNIRLLLELGFQSFFLTPSSDATSYDMSQDSHIVLHGVNRLCDEIINRIVLCKDSRAAFINFYLNGPEIVPQRDSADAWRFEASLLRILNGLLDNMHTEDIIRMLSVENPMLGVYSGILMEIDIPQVSHIIDETPSIQPMQETLNPLDYFVFNKLIETRFDNTSTVPLSNWFIYRVVHIAFTDQRYLDILPEFILSLAYLSDAGFVSAQRLSQKAISEVLGNNHQISEIRARLLSELFILYSDDDEIAEFIDRLNDRNQTTEDCHLTFAKGMFNALESSKYDLVLESHDDLLQKLISEFQKLPQDYRDRIPVQRFFKRLNRD